MLFLILTGLSFSFFGMFLCLLFSANKVYASNDDEKENKLEYINKYKKLTIIFSVVCIFFMLITGIGIGSTQNYEPKTTIKEYSIIDYSEDEIFSFDKMAYRIVCKYKENDIVKSLYIPYGELTIQHKENFAKIIEKTSEYPFWVSLIGIKCDSTVYEIYI